MSIRVRNDELIEKLQNDAVAIVKKHRIRCDYRGNWFSNNQLDSIRYLLETRGWKTARLYQAGKIDQRDRPFDLQKNQALLEIIDAAANSGLDRVTISYAIGKLNSILVDKIGVDSNGGYKSEQRR